MKNKIPKHVILTAAGKGSRMKSINSKLPKELLPVAEKPVIQYAIEESIAADMKDITIIINKHKDVLRKYFEDEKFRNSLFPKAAVAINSQIEKCKISFIYQKKQIGEMDAISYAEKYIGDNPFAILYPDDIHYPFGTALSKLKEAFLNIGVDTIALSEVNQENAAVTGNTGRIKYEKISENLYKIFEFFPKTLDQFDLGEMKRTLRTCGMMISKSHLFEYIKKFRCNYDGKEYVDLDVRKKMLITEEIAGYLLPGILFDVGNPQGYLCCKDYLDKKKDD